MPRRFQAPYPPEFRHEAVRLVRMSRRPIPEVAAELGVNDQTLPNWVFAAGQMAKSRRSRAPTTRQSSLGSAVGSRCSSRNGTS